MSVGWGMTDNLYDSVRQAVITDLIPDDRNANQGTERGNYMLNYSLETYGAGRSVLVDKNGRIIAGNKTARKFGELGLQDVVLVESDGTKLIAVQRTDIDIDTPEGRELAISDNRVSELNLAWDYAVIDELADEGKISLDLFWKPEEIEGRQSENEGNDGGEKQPREIQCVCPNCGCEFTKV